MVTTLLNIFLIGREFLEIYNFLLIFFYACIIFKKKKKSKINSYIINRISKF